MTTLYVVRPDQRGIAAYSCSDSVQHPVRGVEHGWAERPLGEPGEAWAARTCTVRVGTVCAHDWLCTDDLRLAQLVDGLYGASDREREAVVRYLRATDGALDYRADNEDIARAYDFARDKGKALERAAVVAWLRTEVRKMPEVSNKPAWFHAADLADHIERGEHRREEGA